MTEDVNAPATPDSGYYTADLTEDDRGEVSSHSTGEASSSDHSAPMTFWSPELVAVQSITVPGLYDDVDDIDFFAIANEARQLLHDEEDEASVGLRVAVQ